MEQGRKLLGILEVAGAALFAAGLALRSVHRRLRPARHPPSPPLKGRQVLVLGVEHPLGRELSLQLSNFGCRVVCSSPGPEPPPGLPHTATYFSCDPTHSSSLKQLGEQIAQRLGQLDIVIWATGHMQQNGKTPLDQITEVVKEDLMKHFNVVSQFMPILCQSPGSHLVTVDPGGLPAGTFAATGRAITDLANTLTHQMANSSGTEVVRMLRVLRRPSRAGAQEQEDWRQSAAAVLAALQHGDTSITLPSASQHMKNTLRYLKGEIGNLWNQTILRQWKLTK